MSLFHLHTPTSHEIWQRSPGLAPTLSALYDAHHLSEQQPEKLPRHSAAAPWIMDAACSCPQHARARRARARLTWTKHLADLSCMFPTRVLLDQTTAALLLGSHNVLFNGWLLKTLNAMKGGPVYPERQVGHMAFNEVIMNIPRAVLAIWRNPSLSI